MVNGLQLVKRGNRWSISGNLQCKGEHKKTKKDKKYLEKKNIYTNMTAFKLLWATVSSSFL